MRKLITWLPIGITAVLMWFARKTNVGVTDYNLFLLGLLAWCLVIIGFYRFMRR